MTQKSPGQGSEAESAVGLGRVEPKLHKQVHADGVIRQTFLVYASNASNALFPLLIAPIVVRTSGIYVFGELAILLLGAQLATLISEYSFDYVGSRRVASKGDAEAVLLGVLVAKMVLCFLAVPIFWVALIVIGGRASSFSLAFAAGYCVGLALQSAWFAVATNRAARLAVSSAAGKGCAILLILTLTAAGESDASRIFGAIAVGNLLSGLIFLRGITLPPLGKNSCKDAWSIFLEGRRVYIGVAISAGQNLLGQMASAVLLGVGDLAKYTIVDRFARFISAGLKPIFQVAFPRMALLHSTDAGKASRLVVLSSLVWLAVGALLIAAAWLVGEGLLSMIFGGNLPGTQWLLVIIVAWLVIGVLNNIVCIQGLVAAGRDDVFATSMLIGLLSTAATVAAVWLVIPELRAEHIALAVLIGEFAMFVRNAFQFRRHMQEPGP